MDPKAAGLSTAFRPLSLLGGGHRQTPAGHVFRARLEWRRPTEDVVVDAPEEVKILLRVSWQPERERPALLIIHGLEGCDRFGYVLSTAEIAYTAGWHVVRMNRRGCGDGLAVCARLYKSGLTTDLLAVLGWLASRVPHIVLCVFSLGANLALLTLARPRDAISSWVVAVAAVCPPLDLAAAAARLARRRNRFYQSYFHAHLGLKLR